MIPDGVTGIICKDPFFGFGCGSLTVTFTGFHAQKVVAPLFPKGTRYIFPEGFLRQKCPLHTALLRGKFQIDIEDYAYLAVFQTATTWTDKCVSDCVAEEVLPVITRLLEEDVDKLTLAKTRFFLSWLSDLKEKIDPAIINAAIAALKKRAPKSAEKETAAFESSVEQLEKLIAKPNHPIEILAEHHLKDQVISKEILKKAKSGLPYADGSGNCSSEALSLLLAEYEDQWTQNAEKVRGDMSTVEILVGAPKVRPSKVADEIAASLDRTALIQFLSGLAYGNFYRSYILVYARFADEAEIERFTSEIEKKKRGHAKERYWAQNAKQALYLSETTAAVRYFERRGGPEYYAEMRGKSVDALRIERLYNFGLDKTGKKVYDLGEKEIRVILNNDLTLSLFDEAAGKIVKSIPKRGATEEKHAAAAGDFAALKKKIKLAQTTQFEQLFKAFLRGTSQQSNAWKDIYAKDPVFGRIAGLIIWEQGHKTFTLKDGQPIDSAEQAYAIGDAPITVAHPMEMQPEEIKVWQKYFAAYNLKQPFAQIWEPVINFSAVRKDRYSGVELPAYRFKGQEKHGIIFLYDYSSGELEVDFADCSLDLWNKTALGRHEIDLQGTFELRDFEAKKSRASNHIIGLLDKWTVYGRILKDDNSIVEQLPQFTLAQIEEFIKLASENNCTGCTAALLEFKATSFADCLRWSKTGGGENSAIPSVGIQQKLWKKACAAKMLLCLKTVKWKAGIDFALHHSRQTIQLQICI